LPHTGHSITCRAGQTIPRLRCGHLGEVLLHVIVKLAGSSGEGGVTPGAVDLLHSLRHLLLLLPAGTVGRRLPGLELRHSGAGLLRLEGRGQARRRGERLEERGLVVLITLAAGKGRPDPDAVHVAPAAGQGGEGGVGGVVAGQAACPAHLRSLRLGIDRADRSDLAAEAAELELLGGAAHPQLLPQLPDLERGVAAQPGQHLLLQRGHRTAVALLPLQLLLGSRQLAVVLRPRLQPAVQCSYQCRPAGQRTWP
jgi:hypothetical protein